MYLECNAYFHHNTKYRSFLHLDADQRCLFSYQFGFMGIVEEEWIATLSTIDPDDITFLDLVEESRALAQELRDQVQNEFIDFRCYLIQNHHQTTPHKNI